MRVGLGFDHRPQGTAEAIVQVVHGAVVEALTGAAGLEAEASGAAPDSEAEGRDLREAVRLIERHNYQVVNLDITLVADGSPSISHLSGLRDELAGAIHVAPANVSVKQAPRTAWLEADGGVAAIAITLLNQIADLDALHASIRSGG